MDRYDRFVALLAQTDPADLPPRAHRWTQPGDPVRQEQLIEQSMRAFVLRRRLEAEPHQMLAPAKKVRRRRAKPPVAPVQLVRRA